MSQDSVFVDSLYDETLAAIVEARDFAMARSKRDVDEFPSDIAARLQAQYLRVTNRLLQSMAWLMAAKAAAIGEMTHAEASGERFAPEAEDWDGRAPTLEAMLPAGFSGLRERSIAIRARVGHLARAASDDLAADLAESSADTGSVPTPRAP